ncbi:MAG TPA: glycosyltransferase family 39 protein, partial [Vicinamibacterales bacterium]|nr:glycosyltransferase family 39 protein [Vicinamibacterales bacterium]
MTVPGVSLGVPRLALVAILGVAAAARLWYLTDGIPHAVGIDEPAIVDRALRILRTGDWNTHLFDYPTLVIYLHALVAILRFLIGAVQGAWTSLDGFDIQSVYAASRFVAAIIGIWTVWLTYRLGEALESPAVGLLAAAQLAILPMHVRESHFILTDVPVTALTTLALLLAARAPGGGWYAYAAAGAAAGFAAAAKYNGGLVLLAVLLSWLLHEGGMPDRRRTLLGAVGAAAGAFLIAAPYTVLDWPAFLEGFAAQAHRFAARNLRPGDPSWLVYLKHLSLAAWWWVPLAVAGTIAVLVPRASRLRWLPAIVFLLAYYIVLSRQPIVFARYALPLVPVLCLLAAAAITTLARIAARRTSARQPARRLVLTAGTLVLTAGFAVHTVEWVRQLGRRDTRELAAEWMTANLRPGVRVGVENNGPTYL